ncbi:MAG: hypothetical protein U0640_12950 [Phycisphaerales bacterium]
MTTDKQSLVGGTIGELRMQRSSLKEKTPHVGGVLSHMMLSELSDL